MHTALLIASLLAGAPAQVFKSADGNRWTVTRQPGATPNSSYEQWYLNVERLGRDGGTEVIRFEEVAWIEPDAKVTRTTRVEFSVDSNGIFQALQRSTIKTEGKAAEETKVLLRWNGKAFAKSKTP